MSDFITKNITYFFSPSIANTDKAIEVALERVAQDEITTVVVATSTGDTGLKVYGAFKDVGGVDVVPVILNAGSKYSLPDGT
ncbi:MAG: hypothetical protein K0B07_01205 [DPANN group archaeon]|nr:hypothetical protein [DPANN group archaeon]